MREKRQDMGFSADSQPLLGVKGRMDFMDQSIKSRIPNAITILRVFIAGGFFAVLGGFRFPDQGILWGNVAIVLFVLAATTDFIDGYLARKWNVVSMFGRLMDPFCDKVLVLGTFIYFAGPRFSVDAWVEGDHLLTMATGIYPWMVVVIIARELLVTSIRGVLESMGHTGGAKWASKFKMIFQSFALPLILLLVVNCNPEKHEGVMLLINILAWMLLAITVWSGLPYITGLLAVIRKDDA
jgi:CDP-diacylglycerol--glycerol-3-phosphate 3-phosphatidyltransferase